MDKIWKIGWAGLLLVAIIAIALPYMWLNDPGVAVIAAANRSDALEAAEDWEDGPIVDRFSYDSVSEHLRAPFARVVPVTAALHKDGYSHYVFSRLAAHPAELRMFARALIEDEDPYARKLAAYSVGYWPDARLDDFLRIYERELERERTGDFMETFNAQSTVEDLVFSAVRLVRDGRGREAGLSFLERIVTDTVTGAHYWNTSQYAISSLLHADAARYAPLFEDWSQYIDGSQENAPVEHSFSIERGWRDAIRKGNTGQIHEMFDSEESTAADAALPRNEQLVIEELLRALDGAGQA